MRCPGRKSVYSAIPVAGGNGNVGTGQDSFGCQLGLKGYILSFKSSDFVTIISDGLLLVSDGLILISDGLFELVNHVFCCVSIHDLKCL